MRTSTIALVAAAAVARAQDDASICDRYTTALLEDNTAENQATLLTLLVNTVVIGNYTQPNTGTALKGILAPGEVEGEEVNLLPYFNGELKSTNRGGDSGESVNFLDGGGAEPLMDNKPANDDESNQYFLLTHLYQFFGALLGCSQQGMAGFDSYQGETAMYEVHKFMGLNYAEMTYFITQVALAAESFGVSEEDIMTVGEALNSLFNVKCAPATAVIPGSEEELQSMCIDEETCPDAENADCEAYPETPMEPSANSTMTGGAPTPTDGGDMPAPTDGGDMPAPTDAEPSAVPTGAAATLGFSFAAVAAALAAFAL